MREAKLKAIASALQPESLDLTQYARARAPSRERELRVRADEAAGALAYAALPQYQDANGKPLAANDAAAIEVPGDPLAVLLLRLKYAESQDRDVFDRARALLMHRHGGLFRRGRETLNAVAQVALFEWVNDACPTCRGKRHGVKVGPCGVCRPPLQGENGDGSERSPWRRSAERHGGREAAVLGPAPGCPKCRGMGRLFQDTKPGKGMKCLSCHSTGRKNLTPKQRGRMVNERIASLQLARGVEKPFQLSHEAFIGHWHPRLYHFLDVLRATDRRLVQHVDICYAPRHPRAIETDSMRMEGPE